jgi:hypothetical protein
MYVFCTDVLWLDVDNGVNIMAFISLMSEQNACDRHANSRLMLYEVHNKCFQDSNLTHVLFNNVIGTNVLCITVQWDIQLYICGGL